VDLTSFPPAVFCIAAFVLGAIPFGFVAGWIKGVDLREHGSKNIGATNVLRVLGWKWGLPVFLLDTLKGYLPLLATQQAGLSSGWMIAVGLCAVLGHIFSPFVRFRGGKGVATSLGVLIGLSWQIALASFAVFLVVVAVTRWVSLGSILASLTQAVLFFVGPASWLVGEPLPSRLFAMAIAIFVVIRHRANIARIRNGTESRIGEKAAPKPEGSNGQPPQTEGQ
jgi:acyl phosphate:glycerol-3-phosphate acyltransferase